MASASSTVKQTVMLTLRDSSRQNGYTEYRVGSGLSLVHPETMRASPWTNPHASPRRTHDGTIRHPIHLVGPQGAPVRNLIGLGESH